MGGTLDPVTLGALTRSAGLCRSPLGVVIVDTDLRIAWANQAAGRLGDGMPATAWAGRRLGEVLPDMDTGPVEQSLRQVLAAGEPVADLEVRSHAGAPGEERFWSCTQFPVTGTDGQTAGVTVVLREVTEQARNLLPGHPPAPTSPQHSGPVHRRAHRGPGRRHQHRHGAPCPHPHHAQPAARQPGLRHAAGHPGPPPGRRHRHPHGPNLTPARALPEACRCNCGGTCGTRACAPRQRPGRL